MLAKSAEGNGIYGEGGDEIGYLDGANIEPTYVEETQLVCIFDRTFLLYVLGYIRKRREVWAFPISEPLSP